MLRINNLEESKNLENDKFKKFALHIIEHLVDLLKESQKFEELQVIFDFVFKENPTYEEIVKQTPKLQPLLFLQSQQKNSQEESLAVNSKWQSLVKEVRTLIRDYDEYIYVPKFSGNFKK